jgi:hypothetical protein
MVSCISLKNTKLESCEIHITMRLIKLKIKVELY